LKLWGFLALAAVTALLLIAVQALPPLRGTDTPIAVHVDGHYLANAARDMATPNVVTAILGDYRGYDTFGETTVIFAAGLSCYALLRRIRR
jgi:multicomponent Na+:H+ antiporter subunit B